MRETDDDGRDYARQTVLDPATLLALALLVAVMAVSLFWLTHSDYNASNDSSVYIVTARALLNGEGYSYVGIPFIVRPPGFSVLLLPVLAAFGTNFLALHIYISLFGILSVAFLFLFAKPRLGVWPAFFVALAIWLSPGYQKLCQQVLSDVPGAALLMICLVVERWARRNPFPRRDLWLAVLIAGATYVRSMTLFLIPAILISRLLHWLASGFERPPFSRFLTRQVAMLVIVPFLLLLPWNVRNSAIEPPAPAEEYGPYSYSVAMWHTDMGDPTSEKFTTGEILERVPLRMKRIVPVLGSRMQTLQADATNVAIGVFGLLCWFVVLVRRCEPAEFFVGAALAVLSIYFGFVSRLVLPIWLLVWVAVAEVIMLTVGTLSNRRAGRVAVACLALVMIGIDFDADWQQEGIRKRHRLRTEVTQVLTERFPPDAVVLASNARHFNVYLNRPVYNLDNAMRRGGIQRVQEIIDEKQASAVVVVRRSHFYEEYLGYLRERYDVEANIERYVVFRTDRPRREEPLDPE